MVAAFAAVYIIWGSTYLAIRFAIEDIPPLLMAGARFLLGGGAFYLFARAMGAPKPTATHWRTTALIGLLMPAIGTGGITWAEKFVPSGLTALLVGTVPMLVVLFEWLQSRDVRPNLSTIFGLIAGFAGVAVLVGPGHFAGAGSIHPVGAIVILGASVSWAYGSAKSNHLTMPSSDALGIGMKMLWAGVMLIVFGLLIGEGSDLQFSAIGPKAWSSFWYLVIFGSSAFGAYLWLIKHASPSRAATYAYVNPVIAVFLGWAMGDEALAPRTLLALVLIVGAVILIISSKRKKAELVVNPATDDRTLYAK